MFITSKRSESSFFYLRNYESYNHEPKDARISKLKFIEFLTSRKSLAGVKSFWTVKISNILSKMLENFFNFCQPHISKIVKARN